MYFCLTLQIYSFFLSFQHVYFHCFIPSWPLALVLFFRLCFSQFCSGRHNFWFSLFHGSIYCTVFLLYCFDFAYECIRRCVYSVTLFIVVINFSICIGLLQFCGVFLFSFFWFFFPLFFIILIFNFLKPIIFFLHLFLCLSFLLFFSPCS